MRNTIKTGVFLPAIFLCCQTVVLSQNYFTYSKEIPLELGKGFNIANPSEPKLPVFENTTGKYEDQAGEVEIYYKLIESSESFNKEFGADASLSARILFKKLSANFQVDDKYVSSGDYQTLVFKAKCDFGNKGLSNFTLLPAAQKLLDQGKYDDFIERYGTHFVQKTNTGVSIYVFVSYNKSYLDDDQTTEGSISGNGKIFGGEASINRAINRAKKDKQVHIEIYSSGPIDGLPALSTILDNSEDPIATVKEAVSTYLKSFKRESSKTIGYYYSPFSLLGVPKDKILWSETRENNLVTIKEEYINTIDGLDALKEFKEACIYKKSSGDQKAKFESLVTVLEHYRDSLVGCHKQCLNLDNKQFNETTFKLVDFDDQAEAIVSPMMVLANQQLGNADLEKGRTHYWTYPESCAENNTLRIKFKTIVCQHPSWQNLNVKVDLVFKINDIPFTTYTKTFVGKHNITINEILPIELYSQLYGIEGNIQDMKFQIEAKNIQVWDDNGSSYDSKVPLSGSSLNISIE